MPTAKDISRRIHQASLGVEWSENLQQTAGRAIAALLLEELVKAEAELTTLKNAVNDYEVVVALAVVSHMQGNYAAANSHAREAANLRPLGFEPWLLGFRASMADKDHNKARRWLDAMDHLAPRDPRTLRCKAALAWENGELGTLRSALRDLPDAAVFAKNEDADLTRLLHAPSIVVGDGRVSVLIGVFHGAGLRTLLVGWKDSGSALPKPVLSYQWRAVSKRTNEQLVVERLAMNSDTHLLGVRVNGLENKIKDAEPKLMGMLEVVWKFPGIGNWDGDAYGGLLVVDVTKHLVMEPRRLWARQIRGIADDDWLSLPATTGGRRDGSRGHSSPQTGPKVFISYAREDADTVGWLYRRLSDHGILPWRDEEALKIGQHFEVQIQDAIEESDFVVICLSETSLSKRGYVQVELRRILDEAERRPMGSIYVLPVRIDGVELPRALRGLHYVDLFPDRSTGAERVATEILDHWQDNKVADST